MWEGHPCVSQLRFLRQVSLRPIRLTNHHSKVHTTLPRHVCFTHRHSSIFWPVIVLHIPLLPHSSPSLLPFHRLGFMGKEKFCVLYILVNTVVKLDCDKCNCQIPPHEIWQNPPHGIWQHRALERKEFGHVPCFNSVDHRHRRRTQSVLTRRPPHPERPTGVIKQKLSTLIWHRSKQYMLSEPQHPILIRAGIHLRSRKMVQYNGFPKRLLELVRIFTSRLMMTRWRRLCMKFVGADMIERVITVGVRQNQKKHMLSKTLPNMLSCVSRLTIKLDRLIVSSKSSHLGWFLYVSLIVTIKGRSPVEVLLIVIIK